MQIGGAEEKQSTRNRNNRFERDVLLEATDWATLQNRIMVIDGVRYRNPYSNRVGHGGISGRDTSFNQAYRELSM